MTWDGAPIKCPDESDLVDPRTLLGDVELPSVERALEALPSPSQLLQLDTLVPVVGYLGALLGGYFAITAASQSLRPEDAATTRRRREERERLGVSEADEEQRSLEQEQAEKAARDNWLAVGLIVIFELALFNLRNVDLP